MRFTVDPVVIFGITPFNHTFPPAEAGYTTQTASSFTITNTGFRPTGTLSVQLSGANAESFVLSTTSLASIAGNSSSSFTIVPRDGLPEGTYTATITVSNTTGQSLSAAISFTVNPEP